MGDVAAVINALSADKARDAFARCCGAQRWIEGMLARRSFSADDELFAAADAIWAGLERTDFLEAFSHHPAIGASGAQGFSAREQAQVAQASAATLQELETMNRRYQQRFGFVFLVCATGKSAGQMLALLRARIDNAPEVELRIAAAEQAKITRLRLEKLAMPITRPSSPITSHVLDTALGRPARDLAVRLDVLDDAGAWQVLADRVTSDDGRVTDLLPPASLEPRTYRLTFATAAYFAVTGRSTFYPRVEVVFDVTAAAAAAGEHFHVPLLVSPFGYSTYRGS